MVLRKTTDDTTANLNAVLGLSGLDTAGMLKQMMQQYKKPISLVSQKQQLVIWRQERYRESITKIREFASKFLDYMNPATNLLSPGTFKKLSVNNSGSEYVKISATGSTSVKAEQIEIEKMPTFSSIQGQGGITTQMQGTGAPDWAGAAGRSLSINMDGIVRHVAITPSIDSAEKLQAALDSAFGAGNVIVEEESPGGALVFKTGAGANQITIYDGTSESARYYLGFGSSSNTSNRLTLDTSLDAMRYRLNTQIEFKSVPTGGYDSSGHELMHDVVQFAINGRSFEFDSMVSLRTVIDTVNNDPAAGVTIRYDNAKDAFTMTAKTGGPGKTVSIVEQETSLFGAIGLAAASSERALPASDTRLDIFCGYIDPDLATMVNGALSLGEPYSFSVTVDGVSKTITLDNGADVGGSYTNLNDILAGLNAQLTAAFPDARLTAVLEEDLAAPGNWMLFIEVDRTPPAPGESPTWASSVSISAPAGMPEEDAAAMFTALGMGTLPRYVEGAFGKVTIGGMTLQVDRTEFEYNGVGYALLKETPAGAPVEYSFSADADSIVSTVREFIDAYNQIVAMIEGALREKRDKDYTPLTDELRADMKDTEIEKWEAKAKLGLLRADTNFISFSSKLRQCLFNPVLKSYGGTDTIGMSFESVGIFTRSYDEYGALHLDEAKLRAAIDKDLDAVAQLFTKQADTLEYDDSKSVQWNARQQQLSLDKTAGIAVRISAVIDEYTRTTRDSYGNKGIMVERAGVLEDMSSENNAFSREILQYDAKITALWERYDRIEAQYIKTLSRLEVYVQMQNVQSSWLMEQFSSYNS